MDTSLQVIKLLHYHKEEERSAIRGVKLEVVGEGLAIIYHVCY